VGKTQEGSNRYVAKSGSDTVYVISSWAADWATAEPSKFEKPPEIKPDVKNTDDKKPAEAKGNKPGGSAGK
jgi:hypothetical protein